MIGLPSPWKELEIYAYINAYLNSHETVPLTKTAVGRYLFLCWGRPAFQLHPNLNKKASQNMKFIYCLWVHLRRAPGDYAQLSGRYLFGNLWYLSGNLRYPYMGGFGIPLGSFVNPRYPGMPWGRECLGNDPVVLFSGILRILHKINRRFPPAS